MPRGVYMNSFFSSFKKPFDDKISVAGNSIIESHKFAYEMAFGEGKHRSNRSGGTLKRTPAEIYSNTLCGKISEFELRRYLSKWGDLKLSDIDLSVHDLGVWDNIDLEVNSKNISIKSSSFFSQFLLLETKDYKADGTYAHNRENKSPHIYVLSRIKPDTKKEIQVAIDKLNKNNENEVKDFLSRLEDTKFFIDFPGFIIKDDLLLKISGNDYKKQGDKINNKVSLDADNYVFDVAELKDIDQIINFLN